jgi:spore photoproduct lyase
MPWNEALSGDEPRYLPRFSHLYVEEGAMEDPVTKRLLAAFPRAQVVPIAHYKDVFNRRRQNILLQHRCQNLIVAGRREKSVFPGAPVCQSFGNEHFYYCSSVMNCLYDCSYCYLKGMYPSGNLVVFADLDRIFAEVETLLAKFPVYLCVSYDTDLLPLEGLLGYVSRWCAFTKDHPGLSIEIRTKCGRQDLFASLPKSERVIFAFTLSPKEVISSYEQGAGSLAERLLAARAAKDAGFPIRLCFDPVLALPGWERAYGELVEETAKTIDLAGVRDFSVGTFRISDQYLAALRRCEPGCALVQYPFVTDHGTCSYLPALAGRMEEFLAGELRSRDPEAKIFFWEEPAT